MSSKGFRIAKMSSTPGGYKKDKLKLLTYSMALAQPSATVPLLKNTAEKALALTDSLSSNFRQGRGAASAQSLSAEDPFRSQSASSSSSSLDNISRRWVRDADELCVASIRRSNNINRINSYVATYKFDDPHWQPFLLPEVHVLPPRRPRGATSDGVDSKNEEPSCASSFVSGEPSSASEGASSGGDDSGNKNNNTSKHDASSDPYEVHIDYNKLVNIELISRHANFALRHLVQKGHAMYLVNYAQHSVLEMRGLIESSHITCSYGIRGERLRTHMLHIGPLDVRDVIEVDPLTHRVRFNLQKKNVRKGVVAISQVEGYGTWFQRKPMLWQRTRRIGALQSQMGAFAYQLCPRDSVGRIRDYEVALLEEHVRQLGGDGGMEAVGIIASSQVARNGKLYMGQLEAPVIAAVDAVHQLAHRAAVQAKLVRPLPEAEEEEEAEAAEEQETSPSSSQGNSNGPLGETARDSASAAAVDDLRRHLSMERLLPVSWTTRTPPPYVPLEGDLPFRLQLSKPAVVHTECSSSPAVFPSGGTVGSPFISGVPLSMMEYNMHQGVDHYVFDDAPSARPMKWWNQKSNMPYNGYMYFLRSGLLDYAVPSETYKNPLAPAAEAHKQSSRDTQRVKRQRRHRRMRRVVKAEAAAATAAAAQQLRHAEDEPVDDAGLHVMAQTEAWLPGSSDLVDHGEEARHSEAQLAALEENERQQLHEKPPLSEVVPPTAVAAERAARYTRLVAAADDDDVDSPSVSRAVDGSSALLKRQLRQRAARRAANKRKKTTTKSAEEK